MDVHDKTEGVNKILGENNFKKEETVIHWR
jgi:hypothetical protein